MAVQFLMRVNAPNVKAQRALRGMAGGAQSQLIQCDDGKHYVCKFMANPQGRRILINEVVSWVFLRSLGIQTPDIAFVEITDGFLRSNPNVYCSVGTRRIDVAPGTAFGSQYPGNPTSDSVWDFLPDALLPEVVNREHFLAALVADKWLYNSDGRQAIFFRAHIVDNQPGQAATGWLALMIDNGHAFEHITWRLGSSPEQGLYSRRAVYGPSPDVRDFERWFDALAELRYNLIDAIVDSLPLEWVQDDRNELLKLLHRLYKRRDHIPQMVLQSIEWIKEKRRAGGVQRQPIHRITNDELSLQDGRELIQV